ncbi:hypothetical protein HHK36_024047 [Tetracentron sinense]|uniref:SMP-LTD domain-containing protein n=1 Tax=Tetracentron sinense TaxID=13715 RepID=A0A834YJJ4_TETSI|nr:hypothetical protein HHK36_024047 [Tetracentron sinense]
MFSLFLGILLGALTIIVVEALALLLLLNRLISKNEAKSADSRDSRDLDTEQSLDFAYNKQFGLLDLSKINSLFCAISNVKIVFFCIFKLFLGMELFDFFVYQGVVWVLESEKVPKTDDKLPKEQKSKKEIFEVHPVKRYAKIKDRSLILTDSDSSHVKIRLVSCMIAAVSATNLSSRKWAKRYPIKVESRSSVVYNGSKTCYLYLETSWEKESWCKALRLASCDKNERLNWYAKLSEEFRSYLTSLNAGYPSFMKPSTGFYGEPTDRANRFDGSSSKVRLFLKKLAKKASKNGVENKASGSSSSGREERKIGEKSRSVQDIGSGTGSVKTALTEKTANSSLEEDTGPPLQSTLSHSGSQSLISVISEADSDDKFVIDEGTLCWNLLISRLFFDAKRNAEMKSFIQARIQRTLSNMRIPSYIGGVTCTDLDPGNLPPYIHSMRVLPMDMNEVWAMELDIEYSGGAILDIETRLEVREPDFQKGIVNTSLESSSVEEATSELLEGFEYFGNQLKLSEKTVDEIKKKDEGVNTLGKSVQMSSNLRHFAVEAKVIEFLGVNCNEWFVLKIIEKIKRVLLNVLWLPKDAVRWMEDSVKAFLDAQGHMFRKFKGRRNTILGEKRCNNSGEFIVFQSYLGGSDGGKLFIPKGARCSGWSAFKAALGFSSLNPSTRIPMPQGPSRVGRQESAIEEPGWVSAAMSSRMRAVARWSLIWMLVSFGNVPTMWCVLSEVRELWIYGQEVSYWEDEVCRHCKESSELLELQWKEGSEKVREGLAVGASYPRGVNRLVENITSGFPDLETFQNLLDDAFSHQVSDLSGKNVVGDKPLEANLFPNQSAAEGKWKGRRFNFKRRLFRRRVSDDLTRLGVPLSLTITVASLRGTVRLHIKPPPSDQLWFGFTSMPDIDFNLESSIGDHKMSSAHVALLLGSRLKAAIRETLVLPNCESICIPWMLAEKDDWVPRKVAPFIWVKQEAVSDPTVCEAASCQSEEAKTKLEASKGSKKGSSNHLEDKREKTTNTESVQLPTYEPVNKSASSSERGLATRGSTTQSNGSESLQDLRAPLLRNDEAQENYNQSRPESPENQAPLGSEIVIQEHNFGGEDTKTKRTGRRARFMDLGKKVGDKLEEKRRNIEEKGRQIVDKMRGPAQ